MEFKQSDRLLREANSEVLIQMAEEDSRIVLLDADLMGASAFSLFAKRFPHRCFNCGIAESNMLGVAGGLSAAGLIPVVHSFACFASRRAADQVFMAGVYGGQTIKIIGTDPGACNTANGGSHMALEDIGIFRSMTGVTIVDPTDEAMLTCILPQLMKKPGVDYLRLYRKTKRKVYADGTSFTLGKAHLARDGHDLTIIAEGALMVPEALEAAERLEQEGIQARVLDMFTVKPLDREAVILAARETGAILSAENHSVCNGLGSAVAEVLAEERLAVPFARIGFREAIGETANVPYVMKKFGMDAASMVQAAHKLIEAKSTPTV